MYIFLPRTEHTNELENLQLLQFLNHHEKNWHRTSASLAPDLEEEAGEEEVRVVNAHFITKTFVNKGRGEMTTLYASGCQGFLNKSPLSQRHISILIGQTVLIQRHPSAPMQNHPAILLFKLGTNP